MSNQPLALLSRTKTLTANQSFVDNVRGKSLHVYSLSGAINIRVGKDRGFSAILAGDWFELQDGEHFDEIELLETAGSSASITYRIGDGKVGNQSTQVTNSVKVKSGDAVSTPALVTAGTSATALVALNTSRNAILIQNLHTSSNLWVGDSNVGNDAAPRGTRVLPGETLTVATGAALYVRRGASTDISVSTMELS